MSFELKSEQSVDMRLFAALLARSTTLTDEGAVTVKVHTEYANGDVAVGTIEYLPEDNRYLVTHYNEVLNRETSVPHDLTSFVRWAESEVGAADEHGVCVRGNRRVLRRTYEFGKVL